jgi:hypothetical protein
MTNEPGGRKEMRLGLQVCKKPRKASLPSNLDANLLKSRKERHGGQVVVLGKRDPTSFTQNTFLQT